MRRLLVALMIFVLYVPHAERGVAQDPGMCGDAPRVDDARLKGQLEGKAKFLSSFLGGAELTGQIESERRDIFSKTPEGLKARADAYLQYQVCILVFSDARLSTSQKVDELIRVRNSFSAPVH